MSSEPGQTIHEPSSPHSRRTRSSGLGSALVEALVAAMLIGIAAGALGTTVLCSGKAIRWSGVTLSVLAAAQDAIESVRAGSLPPSGTDQLPGPGNHVLHRRWTAGPTGPLGLRHLRVQIRWTGEPEREIVLDTLLR